jgi:hypothetical protein
MKNLDKKKENLINELKKLREQIRELKENEPKCKRIQKELKVIMEEFHILVMNSPDVIMKVDRNGHILFINRTISSFTKEGVIDTSSYN